MPDQKPTIKAKRRRPGGAAAPTERASAPVRRRPAAGGGGGLPPTTSTGGGTGLPSLPGGLPLKLSLGGVGLVIVICLVVGQFLRGSDSETGLPDTRVTETGSQPGVISSRRMRIYNRLILNSSWNWVK